MYLNCGHKAIIYILIYLCFCQYFLTFRDDINRDFNLNGRRRTALIKIDKVGEITLHSWKRELV